MDYDALHDTVCAPAERVFDPVELVNPSWPVAGSDYPFPNSARRFRKLLRDIRSPDTLARFAAEMLAVLAEEHALLPALGEDTEALPPRPDWRGLTEQLAEVGRLQPLPAQVQVHPYAVQAVHDEIVLAVPPPGGVIPVPRGALDLRMPVSVGVDSSFGVSVPFPDVPEEPVAFTQFTAGEFACCAWVVARMDHGKTAWTDRSEPWHRFRTLLLTLNVSRAEGSEILLYQSMLRFALALGRCIRGSFDHGCAEFHTGALSVIAFEAQRARNVLARWWNRCRRVMPVCDWKTAVTTPEEAEARRETPCSLFPAT